MHHPASICEEAEEADYCKCKYAGQKTASVPAPTLVWVTQEAKQSSGRGPGQGSTDVVGWGGQQCISHGRAKLFQG